MYTERKLTSVILPKKMQVRIRKRIALCAGCRYAIWAIRARAWMCRPCCADLAGSGHQAKHAKNYYKLTDKKNMELCELSEGHGPRENPLGRTRCPRSVKSTSTASRRPWIQASKKLVPNRAPNKSVSQRWYCHFRRRRRIMELIERKIQQWNSLRCQWGSKQESGYCPSYNWYQSS